MSSIENISVLTDELRVLAKKSIKNSKIDLDLYSKYNVKRGLRDLDGRGVLTGLTEISEIVSYGVVDMDIIPCKGKLYYRGVDIKKFVRGFILEDRFGFEEATYLLLFGELPNKEELSSFLKILRQYRTLPTSFVRDIVMKAPSKSIMNTLARSVLTLYSYDDRASDTSIENVLRQCLQLIAVFPNISVYAYNAYKHYHDNKDMFIHNPQPDLSSAENILYTLRADKKYTKLEARVLDLALVLHAEHGGGNNSTFTTHVVTSTGTDTYSTIAAALGSLKGSRHGGANIKVVKMFDDLKKNVKDLQDEKSIEKYLNDILEKKAFDRSGLIYGIGHAIYSVSDPRAEILKKCVKDLAKEKNNMDEFNLYTTVEKIAIKIITEKRKIYKGVCANIDFYSGLVYKMLGLPEELFIPIFAMSRVVGWSAHRIEELINMGKIIRPAYKNVSEHKKYVSLGDR